MLRDIDLKDISDGKLYRANDLVKADCGGCTGCSQCCHGMGTSIVLDPLDMHRLCLALQQTPDQLLQSSVELNVSDGIILPNLKMSGPDEACSFLNSDGRCSIHASRPGICRLFPLGRYYDEDSFQYFLQIDECPKREKSKVKVKKWLDTPDFARYEKYIADWHFFLKPRKEFAMNTIHTDQVKALSIYILQTFYLLPYDPEGNFYDEFYLRLKKAMESTDQFL